MSLFDPIVPIVARPIHRAVAYYVLRRDLKRQLKVLPGVRSYVADRWRIDHENREFTRGEFLRLVRHDSSLDWVARYLHAGIDLGGRSSTGDGPLHHAAGNGAKDVLDLLLTESNLEVDARNDEGDTALIVAARHGREGSVEVLLRHRADPGAHNHRGESALLEAARRGHERVVETLREAGAREPDLDRRVERWRARRELERAGFRFTADGRPVDGASVERVFLNHVEAGRCDRVRTFLLAGIDALASQRGTGDTALHLAAGQRTPAMTALLVGLTGSRLLEARNRAGDTPLIVAAREGKREVLDLLLEEGARVGARNDAGDSALIEAARNDHWKIFELLRARGATEEGLALKVAMIRLERVGVPAEPEELFRAIADGRMDQIGWLLEAGVGERARSAGGETPLLAAIRRGPDEAVAMLLETGTADLEARDRTGDTALIAAARTGRAEIVERLLELGAKVNARNDDGDSALIEAARRGHVAIVGLLERAGAEEADLDTEVARWHARREIDASEHELTGQTFLRLVRTGQAFWVERFLDAGIDPGLRDEDYATPLHLAAALPTTEVLEVLLDHGEPDLEVGSSAGDTPLIVAARQGNTPAVRLLIDHGAVTNARNREGVSALLEAARRGYTEIVRVLEERGAAEPDLAAKVARWKLERDDLFTPEELVRAAHRDDRDRLRELLIAGIDVNALGGREETALHAAVRLHRTAVVLLLLERSDLDVEARDGRGRRAAELAAARGFDDVLALLTERGARLDERVVAGERLRQRGYEGLRPSDFVQLSASGQRELVGLFLDAGMAPDTQDDRGRRALVEAARAGRAGVVELLLDRGASVDLEDRYGVRPLQAAEDGGHTPVAALLREAGATPMHRGRDRLAAAVAAGDLATVRAALDDGASPDELSERGEPMLVAAVLRGQAAVVELLLARGADPALRDRDERTALLVASEADGGAVLAKLLEHPGIDLEERSPDGATPLIVAARHGRLEAVRALLDAGAEAGARDTRGRTARLAAQTAGHDAIVELLEEAGDEESLEAELLAAAAFGDEAAVAGLLERGADPEVPDPEGRTPLARAAARGWTSVVETLLAVQARVDASDADGRTPLMLAARAGWEEAVTALLNGGAEIDRTDGEGATALLLAAEAGRGGTVTLLVEALADPNLFARGTTPLVEICHHGHLEAARALIAAGAEVEQKEVHFGFSPWMTAELAGHQQLLDLLEDEGAERGRQEARVFLAARRGDEDGVASLLLDSVTVDAEDREGWTPLMVAAAEGHAAVARRLLDAGADPAATDRRGELTPLLLAAECGHLGVLECLVSHLREDPEGDARALLAAARNGHAEVVRTLAEARGASVDGPKGGGVPLVAAASRGHYQAVRALLELGADHERRGRDGLNALMAAQLHGHDRVVELLLDHGTSTGLLEGQLLLAAGTGDTEEIERLLGAVPPPDLHVRDGRGLTPVMRAARGGHYEAFALLLGHEGSDADRRRAASDTDRGGNSTLMLAAKGGDLRIVRRLLALDADPAAVSRSRRTALLEASREGHSTVVARLLDAFEDGEDGEDGEARKVAVNHRDARGATPLLEALLARRVNRSWLYGRVVELLVEAGAEVGRAEGELLRAVRSGDVETAKGLLRRLDLDRLPSPRPPLHLAVESGSEAMVELLLRHGVDVDAAGPRGGTALMLAAQKGRRSVAALLLDAHADPDRRDSDGATALHRAIAQGHTAVAQLLVGSGADLNVTNRAGQTPLLLSVETQSESAVRLLLDRVAAVRLDERDRRGRTALALGHLHGSFTGTLQADLPEVDSPLPDTLGERLSPIETDLLEAGAREGWDDAELILAIRSADEEGPPPELMTAANVHVRDLDGATPLLLACRAGDLATAGALLDREAGTEVRDERGRTPVMEAACTGSTLLVERLLANGQRVDLDAQDEVGQTALLEAAGAGCDELMQLLLDRGANPRIANHEGENLLLRAAGRCSAEAVRTILDRRVNLCARTKGYRTAITAAAEAGNLPVLELLLDELGRRLRGQSRKRRTVINAVDPSSRTALDYAVAGGHEECVEVLRRHGATSVTETDFVVYTTPDGHCYHRYGCSAIHQSRERGTLKQRFMREAIRKHYEFCEKCTPSLESIDWTC